MYGRMEPGVGTVDISFFLGADLIQICLGAYDLGLNFGPGDIRIMTQGDFLMKVADSTSTHGPKEGHLLRPFLNKKVEMAKWAERGTLVLVFDDTTEIHMLDDSDEFESYTVEGGPSLIVV